MKHFHFPAASGRDAPRSAGPQKEDFSQAGIPAEHWNLLPCSNILMRSDDDGNSWKGPELIIDSVPEAKLRAIDIQLWLAPDHKMWVFWCERDDHFLNSDERHLSTCAVICDDPDADKLKWSEPKRITIGFLRCQPTVLSDGRIILCSYDWTNDRYGYSESSDGGRTWCRCYGGKKLGIFVGL